LFSGRRKGEWLLFDPPFEEFPPFLGFDSLFSCSKVFAFGKAPSPGFKRGFPERRNLRFQEVSDNNGILPGCREFSGWLEISYKNSLS